MSIRVKARQGRVAFTASRGGQLIPHDRFILVEPTPWIDRLLNHHGDIEVETTRSTPVAKPAKTPDPAPAA